LDLFSGKEASTRFTNGIKNNHPEYPAFFNLLKPIEIKTMKETTLYTLGTYSDTENFETSTCKSTLTTISTRKKLQNSFILASFLKLKIFVKANR
jgi:hypothetical protein